MITDGYENDDARPAPRVYEADGLFEYDGVVCASFDPKNLRPPEPPLVAGILPRTGLALLAAPPKTGKTDLATAIALAVATGEALTGGTPAGESPEPPRTVLWVNCEENPAERAAALAGAADHPEPIPHLWFSGRFPALDTDRGYETLVAFLQTKRPALVVVDSLWGALAKLDVTRPKPARKLLTALSDLARLQGFCLLMLHHTNAGAKRPGDSPQVEAAAGATILLRNEPLPADPGRRLVTLTVRGRGLGLEAVHRLVSDAPLRYRPATPEDLAPAISERAARPEDPTAERLLTLAAEEPGTAADLAARAELPLGTARSACRRLRDAGRLRADLRGNALVYSATSVPKTVEPPKLPRILVSRM